MRGKSHEHNLSDLPSILFSYQPVAEQERLRIMPSKMPRSSLPEYIGPTYSAILDIRNGGLNRGAVFGGLAFESSRQDCSDLNRTPVSC